uniref:Uncharacterized protein n=1 Tax=Avena sativa TaxID=4498 RepID=A0ACD5WRI9_AVESA
MESVQPIQDNTVHMATINNLTPILIPLRIPNQHWRIPNQHWQVPKGVSILDNSNQQLLEQNNQLLNQIGANIGTFKIEDNMGLFLRTSNNIKTILDSETPVTMGRMPPIPVFVQEDKLRLLLRVGKTGW